MSNNPDGNVKKNEFSIKPLKKNSVKPQNIAKSQCNIYNDAI